MSDQESNPITYVLDRRPNQDSNPGPSAVQSSSVLYSATEAGAFGGRLLPHCSNCGQGWICKLSSVVQAREKPSDSFLHFYRASDAHVLISQCLSLRPPVTSSCINECTCRQTFSASAWAISLYSPTGVTNSDGKTLNISVKQGGG